MFYFFSFFFFNDTATTEIYTLSLHDALPISERSQDVGVEPMITPHRVKLDGALDRLGGVADRPDRKSTRLNSSHLVISYAVFCLKKKKIYDSRAYRHTVSLTVCTREPERHTA